MPREVVRASDHDRHRSLGLLAVEWMEHFTVHGPGDVQGDRVVLDDTPVKFPFSTGGATGRTVTASSISFSASAA